MNRALERTYEGIREEAEKTKQPWIEQRLAELWLVMERLERGILREEEAFEMVRFIRAAKR